MNNHNINNTLAELEDNLKKMDSARLQVSNLTFLVSQLTETYKSTLDRILIIESALHYDENYFENKFGESISTLDSNINLFQSKIKNHNISVNSIYETASNDFISLLENSEKKVKLYIDRIEPTLENIQNDYIGNLQKGEDKIITYIDEIKPKIEKTQNDFIKKNDEIIYNLNKKIEEVTGVYSEKISEIKNLDFLKEINRIEVLTKELDSNLEKYYIDILKKQEMNFEKSLEENEKLNNNIINYKTEINSRLDKSERYLKILLTAVVFTLIATILMKFV